MLGKTHFSVGMAAGLALCRPQSITMLVAGTAVAGFGGIISDIDVGTSGAYNKVDRIIGLAVGTITGIVIADVIFHVGIYDRLMADSNIARIITGILAFLCICIFVYMYFWNETATQIIYAFYIGIAWAWLFCIHDFS